MKRIFSRDTVKKNIMTNTPQKIDDIKSKRFQIKHKITYENSHADRKHMIESWKFSRIEAFSFNTHLSFSFNINSAVPEDDVKMVRAAAHLLRMWFQHKKIPSHILWTRFLAVGSDREQVDILVHVPEKHAENFKKNVEKWAFGIRVEPATYDPDRFFAGKPCNLLEVMLRASSSETRSKEPDAPNQASAPMKGSRCFSSMKLGIPSRRQHRAANAAKTLDGAFSVLNIDSDEKIQK